MISKILQSFHSRLLLQAHTSPIDSLAREKINIYFHSSSQYHRWIKSFFSLFFLLHFFNSITHFSSAIRCYFGKEKTICTHQIKLDLVEFVQSALMCALGATMATKKWTSKREKNKNLRNIRYLSVNPFESFCYYFFHFVVVSLEQKKLLNETIYCIVLVK